MSTNGKTAPAKRKRADIRRPLLEIFHKRAGQTLFVSDLATELNYSGAQIRTAINNIRHDYPELNVEAVIPGRAFMARPGADRVNGKVPEQSEDSPVSAAPAKSSTLFSLMGTRKNGNLILEGEDGKLWEATEL